MQLPPIWVPKKIEIHSYNVGINYSYKFQKIDAFNHDTGRHII